jgi:hypothetical protein
MNLKFSNKQYLIGGAILAFAGLAAAAYFNNWFGVKEKLNPKTTLSQKIDSVTETVKDLASGIPTSDQLLMIEKSGENVAANTGIMGGRIANSVL